MRQFRGYALILVLMVLALLSISLGVLFSFQEASTSLSSSLTERRRVFYACDGIGRAATVLAQSYAQTASPTTSGMIEAICAAGGGGCCPTTTDTKSNPTAGSCQSGNAAAEYTRLTSDPTVSTSTTALPKIVPPGFKLLDLQLNSVADPCTTDADCSDGVCVAGRCRVVGPLPNGPFAGMNARQDTVSFGLTAAHTATTNFRCSTKQTLTLGKIAMFQFFLFSDSAITDWHPGPPMRATGRLHANGDVTLGNNLHLERITASGDVLVFDVTGRPCSAATCPVATDKKTVWIATRANPDFGTEAHFAKFERNNATWRDDALRMYKGNALDRAHGVPRLQLPILGEPSVQQGFDARNNVIKNVNDSSGTPYSNARLLVDPVLPGEAESISQQKFAHKADIRIVNGIWFLNTPGSDWPGLPIWSDHGVYTTSVSDDYVGALEVGQTQLRSARGWGTYTPRRFSYYGLQSGLSTLVDDDNATGVVRAVVSYGSLHRRFDAANGMPAHAPMWFPGVRTLRVNNADSWCEAMPSGGPFDIKHDMLDALRVGTAATPCTGPDVVTRGSALLAATRSGFRDGFGEASACNATPGAASRDGSFPPTCTRDRREANILPINFDVGALQQALADTTKGELGSYFCEPKGGSCLMKRRFNGIVWISNPYPNSELGYGPAGGAGQPAAPPFPGEAGEHAGLLAGRPLLDLDPVGDANGVEWTTSPLAVLRDNPMQPVDRRTDSRDDEVMALPFALCSSTTGPAAGEAGEEMTTGFYRFVRPTCAVGQTSRLTGVRIINSRVVNNRKASTAPPTAIIAQADRLPAFDDDHALAQLPDISVSGSPVSTAGMLAGDAASETGPGLTVITNHKMYIVGDVNITSDAFDTSLTLPWVPVLLGGDTIHPMSNAWDDRRSRWGISAESDQLNTGVIARTDAYTTTAIGNGGAPRGAAPTRYYMEVITGLGLPVLNAEDQGLHNAPLFLENWRSDTGDCVATSGGFSPSCPAIIYGSMVLGFYRVYDRWPFVSRGNLTRDPPRRDWGFDPHLNDLAKQPPGAPIFDVSAVKQWSRE